MAHTTDELLQTVLAFQSGIDELAFVNDVFALKRDYSKTPLSHNAARDLALSLMAKVVTKDGHHIQWPPSKPGQRYPQCSPPGSR